MDAARFVLEAAGFLISLATAALPYVEKTWFTVLPVAGRVRSSVMPVAILACVAAVFAGVATARQTSEGLTTGWFALVVFLATAIGLYAGLEFAPRAASGLYIVFFASFSLSITSFLTSRGSRRP
jgi:hypothetical protein